MTITDDRLRELLDVFEGRRFLGHTDMRIAEQDAATAITELLALRQSSPPDGQTADGWAAFNLNHTVKVKLRPEGVELLKRAHDELFAGYATQPYEFTPPEVDEQGRTSFQLWAFMQDFGQHVHLGHLPPFETAIYLQTKDLESVPTPSSNTKAPGEEH